MKKLKLNNGMIFQINPENGRWGIGDEVEGLEKSLAIDKPIKRYIGTNLFVLNSSNTCNLDCIYCSEKNHRKDIPAMSEEMGKKIIDSALKTENPSIVFHGSEPLMNFQFIKRVTEYGEKIANAENKRIDFSIQSNLAYLPKGFLEFIKEHKVGVSTSLDGFPEIQNLTRPFINKKASYDKVMENIQKILGVQGNINVASVITKYNVNRLIEISDFLEHKGVTSWQTIPVERSEYSPSAIELGESYVQLFEKTINKLGEKRQNLKIRTLSQYLSSMFIHNGIDACRACSSANLHPLLAIDTDGEIYPCDFFFGDKALSIGNVENSKIEEIINSNKNLRMRDINNTACSPCEWKNNCGGGCLAGEYYSKDKTSYCETHKKVYNYLANKMPELIEKNLIKPIFEWINK